MIILSNYDYDQIGHVINTKYIEGLEPVRDRVLQGRHGCNFFLFLFEVQ
jgi:acyl-CoA thioesterase FadM